jgi:hypothetical protein
VLRQALGDLPRWALFIRLDLANAFFGASYQARQVLLCQI